MTNSYPILGGYSSNNLPNFDDNDLTKRPKTTDCFDDTEELDPQTKEWLQTAAILGTKKATTAEAALAKNFY